MRYGTKRSYGRKYKSTGYPGIDEVDNVKSELEDIVNQVWDIRVGQGTLSTANGREYDFAAPDIAEAVEAYKEFLLALNKLERAVDDIDIDQMVTDYEKYADEMTGKSQSIGARRSSIGFNRRRRY